MLNIRRILFATDYTACAECAFSHAAHLAEQFDSDLHVVHAAVDRTSDGAEKDAQPRPLSLVREAVRPVQANLDPNGEDDVSLRLIHAQTIGRTVATAILDYAHELDVDLIVMATHGRHGLDHLLNRSVAEEVVCKAPCPVLTIRDCEGTAHNPAVERILAPVDFSSQTGTALVHACELAKIYEARVDLVHVIEEAVLTQVYGLELVSDVVKEVEAGTKQALSDLMATYFDEESAGSVHVVVGKPAGSIARLAEQSASDLIVISSHGRTGLRRFVIGSVAESVVRTASRPVFTVKTFGKSILTRAASRSAGRNRGEGRPPYQFSSSS